MPLHANHFIGSALSAESDFTFTAKNPATGETLEPVFPEADTTEIDLAMTLAEQAFLEFRNTTPEQRAQLLDAIADEILALGDELLERAHAESGLPMGRCTGERGRAVGQTRLFANLIREGSWVNAHIDLPQPDREPLPKPDVRSMLVGIGPVVVFGASNFPLAIGVVGTDTVCALAAGCPVVVKAHPAHPGTCELLASAVRKAIEQTDMPPGIFSMLHGASHETGLHLVSHPAAQAVAFTGSLGGGRALCDAAAARPNPIPVYAEMGSTNPVFLLPGALQERAAAIAEGYVGSVNLGVGQFCTNPGLVVGLAGEGLDAFKQAVIQNTPDVAPATMLHAGIGAAYAEGVKRTEATEGVAVLARSEHQADAEKTQAACVIFSTTAENLDTHPHLVEENFGPSSIIVECDTDEHLFDFAHSLEGHLTATLHGTDEDIANHQELINILQTKVGRLLINGFPTGIEVCHSMHHGGPWPAASHSFFTSIGTGSILRFARPLCFQNFPQSALPDELKNENVCGIHRTIDGKQTQDNC